MSRSIRSSRRPFLCVTVIVVAVDLATKALAVLVVGRSTLGPVAPTRNERFSLGLVGAPTAILVSTMAAVLLLGATCLVKHERAGRIDAVSAGLVFGGGLANFVDRAATGAVHDFLVLGPLVANVADGAFVAGLGLVWRAVWRARRRLAGAVELSPRTR